MKENPVVEAFQKILRKYKVDKPVPRDVQEHIRQVKKSQFRKTAKKAGAVSILFTIISQVFFTLKRFGFSITMVQSSIILAAGLIIIAGTITSGVYVITVGQRSPQSEKKEQSPSQVIENGNNAPVSPKLEKEVPVEKYNGTPDIKSDGPVIVPMEKKNKTKNEFEDEPVENVPGL